MLLNLTRLTTLFLISLSLSNLSIAEEAIGPLVPGFQRFHAAGVAGNDLDPGRLLLGELNCVACHQADSEMVNFLNSKQAPILTDVGMRVRPQWIEEYLRNTHAMKPGTTMPNLHLGANTQEKEENIKALTHFLASTGKVHEVRRKANLIDQGKKLFHEVGCVACHEPQSGTPLKLATSKPLGDLTKKYSIASLSEFIRDPLKVRVSGRMPSLNLKPEEADAIAQYLLKDLAIDLPANMKYEYYEVKLEKLPDFESLKPKVEGEALDFDLTVRNRNTDFAFRFQSFIDIPKKGKYRFFVGSDDGGRILINNQKVAENDGIHPYGVRDGRIDLEAGKHPITVEYFNAGGDIKLTVEFEGPGIKRREITDYLTIDQNEEEKESENKFVLDENLAAKGKIIFSTMGCANCHNLEVDGKKLVGQLSTEPLLQLNLDQGCLGDTENAPKYLLSSHQQQVIKTTLEMLKSIGIPEQQPADVIDYNMTLSNCYACHQRNEKGGVELERNDFFTSTQKEMGDEGRIPPHLNGVGGKLNETWLAKIMAEGAKDRPYMHTRMPKFGRENAGHLVAEFRKIDLLEPITKNISETGEPIGRIKSIGRHLVGDKVFGCIKCHTFNGTEATGVQGIDMTLMTKRLNRDFFHVYVTNPQGYRPGTRMPTAWPNGKSVMKNILDGDTTYQLDSIWEYLSDNEKAKAPLGIGKNPIELIAYREAIIYRNFIEGAGPRAIGVGYPEKANLAFDANDMRLALIWQGAFMDASRHWLGRGQGFQGPLGDNIIEFASGPSFMKLDSLTDKWPTDSSKNLDYQFKGYHLGEQRRPKFRYQYHGLLIEDEVKSVVEDGYPILIREIKISGNKDNIPLYYRAATGSEIKKIESNKYSIDKRLELKLSGGEVILRSDLKDLLLKPNFQDGTATITQKYVW